MYGIDAVDRSARIRKEEVALAFCEREKIESFEPTCLSARAYKLVSRWAVYEDLDHRPLVHSPEKQTGENGPLNTVAVYGGQLPTYFSL